MVSCAYCNATILFGGKTQGDLRFCNAECEQNDLLTNLADQIPADDLARYVQLTHQGDCPKCKRKGPVDVHMSYWIWSALLMTSWSSRPTICCSTCGTKKKLLDALYSTLLGWWGFPWGVILTPVQVIRNLVSIARSPDPTKPSVELERQIRLRLATHLAKTNQT